jgi:hypothetical protein
MLVGAVPHNLSVLPGKVATFCLAKTRMEPITEKEPRLWTVSATHLPENSFTLLPADADVKPTGQLTRPHLGSALGKSLEPRRGLERGERQAGGAFRKDPLVGADQHGSITHWPFTGHDKRAPPTLRRDVLVTSVFLGGTCLSGPPFGVGSSIGVYRGLKSRVESGAKAPHSMECGDAEWTIQAWTADPTGGSLRCCGGHS